MTFLLSGAKFASNGCMHSCNFTFISALLVGSAGSYERQLLISYLDEEIMVSVIVLV